MPCSLVNRYIGFGRTTASILKVEDKLFATKLSPTISLCTAAQQLRLYIYIYIYTRGLFKKYPDWNCSGCLLGGICLQPVLTCSYMS